MLLDEPTNHLDAKNRVEILSLFRRVAKEQGISVVAVLHDINDALRFADKITLLKNGNIIYDGRKKELCESHLQELYEINVQIYNANDNISYAVFG